MLVRVDSPTIRVDNAAYRVDQASVTLVPGGVIVSGYSSVRRSYDVGG